MPASKKDNTCTEFKMDNTCQGCNYFQDSGTEEVGTCGYEDEPKPVYPTETCPDNQPTIISSEGK